MSEQCLARVRQSGKTPDTKTDTDTPTERTDQTKEKKTKTKVVLSVVCKGRRARTHTTERWDSTALPPLVYSTRHIVHVQRRRPFFGAAALLLLIQVSATSKTQNLRKHPLLLLLPQVSTPANNRRKCRCCVLRKNERFHPKSLPDPDPEPDASRTAHGTRHTHTHETLETEAGKSLQLRAAALLRRPP